jgi:hypothetical protein
MRRRRQINGSDKASFAKPVAAALLLGLLWLAIESGAINVISEMIISQLKPVS